MANCKHCAPLLRFFALLSIVAYSQSKIFQFKDNSFEANVLHKPFGDFESNKERQRFVRDTGTAQGSNLPKSKFLELNHPNHNQAVLHWSGRNSDAMFMLTRKREFNGSVYESVTYRSDDYGSTFREVDTQIRGNNNKVVITSYYVSPVDANKLLFVAVNDKLIFKTDDEGHTYSQCNKPLTFSPDYLLFHPNNSQMLLAYDYYRSLLYVSKDFCVNWQLVARHVTPRFSWGVPSLQDDQNVIYAEVEDIESGGYRYMSFKPTYGDDNTTSDGWIGLIDVDSFLLIGKYIFVQKTSGLDTALYVSYERGEFKKAYFPLDQHPLDFTIVNADQDQIFLLAGHKEGHVNLYLSDKTGQFYTISLDNVVSINLMGKGVSGDVYEVKSVHGTYLANQHTSGNPRTLITHNMGGIWSPIPTPKDVAECKDKKCGLHLHLQTSSIYHNRGMPLSEKNAAGLILAHGVVDTELKTDKSSLFISRDGGLTWKATDLQGDFALNILDQGGAVVVVNMTGTNLQKELWYSFDEGDHWASFSYSSKHIHVDGVLNEPGINTLVVSLFGHARDSGWIVVKVNFSSALTRKCNSDDYEPFTPSVEIGSMSHCLLGEAVTYNRQKQGAQCYNGKDYKQQNNTSTCVCKDEDYECDYGYEREQCDSFETCAKKPCTKTSWFDPDRPLGKCDESMKYQQSQGYRLVASDHCNQKALPNKTNKYKSVEKDCPILPPGDLKLEAVVGGQIISRGSEVTFQLLQIKGSKISTTYEWRVPGYAPFNKTGFADGRSSKHMMHDHGSQEVKVIARNTAGVATASISIYVEDRLHGLEVMTPYGAKVGEPVTFRAMGIESDGSADKDTDVHYVWDFGDLATELLNKPLLTWNSTVEYTYSKPSNYTVNVQVVNKLGTVFTAFKAQVYGTLVTVILSFSNYADELNSGTEMWRNMFADYVKKAVVQEVNVSPHKLEVVTIPGPRTQVAVSFLPDNQEVTEDKNLYYLADSLVRKVNSHGLKIEMDANSFGDDELINATSANIVARGDDGAAAKSRKAAWIAAPVALIILVVAVLVFLHYRRKLRGMNPRYRLLQSNSARPDDTSDGLIDNEENTLDDDDPMLDPNPSQPSSQRLTFGDNDDPLGVVIGGRGHGDIGIRT